MLGGYLECMHVCNAELGTFSGGFVWGRCDCVLKRGLLLCLTLRMAIVGLFASIRSSTQGLVISST